MNKEQGLAILERASIAAVHELANHHPSGKAKFHDDGSFIVAINPANGNGKNGHSSYVNHGEISTGQNTGVDEQPLSEVADTLGVVAQHIINLINRYSFIQPKKSADKRSRETYIFTQAEIDRLRKFFKIRGKLHKTVGEAVQILEKDAEYTLAAQKLHEALKQYDGDPESWMEIVEALSLSPELAPQEKEVLLLMEGKKSTLLEAGARLGIKSEREVGLILENAYKKAGRSFFDLYKLVAEL